MSDPTSVPEIYSEDLIYNIKKRLQSKVSKIRTIIDVTCFQYEGIDAIKKALKCVYDVCLDISVSLIIPSFSLTLSTIDKEKGIQLINQACDAISKKIKEFGGDMTIREYPKDISVESRDASFPSGKDDNEDEEEDYNEDEDNDEKKEY
jgi:translation initiation factor 2 subunit 1